MNTSTLLTLVSVSRCHSGPAFYFETKLFSLSFTSFLRSTHSFSFTHSNVVLHLFSLFNTLSIHSDFPKCASRWTIRYIQLQCGFVSHVLLPQSALNAEIDCENQRNWGKKRSCESVRFHNGLIETKRRERNTHTHTHKM